MLVVARQRGVYVIAGQQLSGNPGVLGGDEVHLPEHAKRPHGDVFEVAYRRGYDVERRHGAHSGGVGVF